MFERGFARRDARQDALEAVEGIQGIGVARFSEVDVVRHPLVARIVGAYDARDKKAAGKG